MAKNNKIKNNKINNFIIISENDKNVILDELNEIDEILKNIKNDKFHKNINIFINDKINTIIEIILNNE